MNALRQDLANELRHDADRPQPDPNHALRIRAAWIYYVEGRTQGEVASALGVNRIAVTRLLSEARRRGEVIFRIKSDLRAIVDIERRLQDRYGLETVIVAPFGTDGVDPTQVIAAAAGQYISKLMANDLTVGVGWGRTLYKTLPFIEGRSLHNVRVISLLGGIAAARRFNPAEFAWRFAELFDAEGFLMTAPALVDSSETKRALLERCGLDEILSMAEASDVAILSAGGISNLSTSFRMGDISEADRRGMMAMGCVGDILFNFVDLNGHLVDHPVNERSLAIGLDRLASIPRKVMVSGGREKTSIISAACKSMKLTTLITDEQTALGLLDD